MFMSSSGVIARSCSATLVGVEAHLVEVEVSVGPGLPGIHIVGLGDAAIAESKERVKTASQNSGLEWPRTKIIVSLSPASLRKHGAQCDVAICLAIQSALDKDNDYMAWILADSLVMGEVSLDGTLRPVKGILPALVAAREAGLTRAVVPHTCATQATLIDGIDVLCASTLMDVYLWARGIAKLPSVHESAAELCASVDAAERIPDFADIAGNSAVKHAAEVAAAGGHHMMMLGPPGAGKSLLAQALPGIMPPLTPGARLEATMVHSSINAEQQPLMVPPFVAPHYSVTQAGLIGGGSGNPRPGAVSLAHRGVLFIDEVSEVPAKVLDCLRQPLESGHIRLMRSQSTYELPARFQLLMAANPCACGAEEPQSCRCSVRQRAKYLSNLTGPLRDRVDIVILVSAQAGVLLADQEESSASIRERVSEARRRAMQRWTQVPEGYKPFETNAEAPGTLLRKHYPATKEAMQIIAHLLRSGTLSQRGVDRTLRLAWTLFDLRCATEGTSGNPSCPDVEEVMRALDLHSEEVLDDE